MSKSTNVSIHLDSELKEQSELVLAQFGLDMSTAVTILLRQIVRDKAVPISLNPRVSVKDELLLAQMERAAGFVGRSADEVISEMEQIVERIENGG
jgi:DNA-damage-inducible protein J